MNNQSQVIAVLGSTSVGKTFICKRLLANYATYECNTNSEIIRGMTNSDIAYVVVSAVPREFSLTIEENVRYIRTAIAFNVQNIVIVVNKVDTVGLQVSCVVEYVMKKLNKAVWRTKAPITVLVASAAFSWHRINIGLVQTTREILAKTCTSEGKHNTEALLPVCGRVHVNISVLHTVPIPITGEIPCCVYDAKTQVYHDAVLVLHTFRNKEIHAVVHNVRGVLRFTDYSKYLKSHNVILLFQSTLETLGTATIVQ